MILMLALTTLWKLLCYFFNILIELVVVSENSDFFLVL